MKIKKLVEIICDELTWDEKILEHNNPNKDLVYYDEETFYVRSNLPISLFTSDDRIDYSGKKAIEETYRIGTVEFEFELYTAIDSIIKDVYDCDEQEHVKIVKLCATRVKNEVLKSLDFNEISSMENLIDIIKNKMYYSTLLFRVKRYNCMKEHRNRSYNSNPQEFEFGNKLYKRDLDVVDIDIYDDYISLHCQKEGSKHHEEKINNTSKSIEGEILYSLGLWQNHYW